MRDALIGALIGLGALAVGLGLGCGLPWLANRPHARRRR